MKSKSQIKFEDYFQNCHSANIFDHCKYNALNAEADALLFFDPDELAQKCDTILPLEVPSDIESDSNGPQKNGEAYFEILSRKGTKVCLWVNYCRQKCSENSQIWLEWIFKVFALFGKIQEIDWKFNKKFAKREK